MASRGGRASQRHDSPRDHIRPDHSDKASENQAERFLARGKLPGGSRAEEPTGNASSDEDRGQPPVDQAMPQQQWIYWDIGFLVWGALMFLSGWWLLRVSKRAADAVDQ